MINEDLTLSGDGAALMARHEGFMATWYKDPVGIWTIGYGTTEKAYTAITGRRRDPKDKLEIAQAMELLRRFVDAEAAPAIHKYVSVPLTQPMFDALVCFVYNVGPENFRTSTLLRLLNAANFIGAANQFAVWNKGRVWVTDEKTGKKVKKLVVLPGLVTRRADERDLFLEGLPDG